MKILGLVDINILAGENHSASAKRIINFYRQLSRWHSIDILNVVPIKCNKDTLYINNNLTIYKISLPYTTVCYYLNKFRIMPGFLSQYSMNFFFFLLMLFEKRLRCIPNRQPFTLWSCPETVGRQKNRFMLPIMLN